MLMFQLEASSFVVNVDVKNDTDKRYINYYCQTITNNVYSVSIHVLWFVLYDVNYQNIFILFMHPKGGI